MSYFYFFKNDGECKWMEKEINQLYPLILHEPVSSDDIRNISGLKLLNDYNGKIKFYLILDWVYGKTRGANLEWLDEVGINYVKSIKELPENSGIYITGYDSNIEEVDNAVRNNIPIIDHACPWVRNIKNQLIEANQQSYQIVMLIDKEHMVYNCYKSLFPDDIIVVNPENYVDEISRNYNNKPVYFISYSVFRIKESERISEYIRLNYNHAENKLDGYLKTACCWVKQGLLEEISEIVKKHKINMIWVICSSTGDRSTISVLNEINESGIDYMPIKNIEDIPSEIDQGKRIGVLVAPIPVSKKIKNIVNIIKEKYKMAIPQIAEHDDSGHVIDKIYGVNNKDQII
jgi:4-hydroxy-3-methylbut-2-enyl diphosphate reductase IspH